MENQNRSVLSEEQLDALVQSLLPEMREFFNSERGKKIWVEHLEKNSAGQRRRGLIISPKCKKLQFITLKH